MKKLILLMAVSLTLVAGAKTKILFSFDTEDYTCDRSNDAIRDIANLLRSEGVRGNFNIVGFLGTRLLELKRNDVIDALKYHVIGSQTLYHTRHPDIAEQGDNVDYEKAYRDTLAAEAKCLGMLDAAFGENRCVFWCPPGNSVSMVAMDVYSDLGVPFSAGCGFVYPDSYVNDTYKGMLARPGKTVAGLWYFNQYHAPYSLDFHLERMIPKPNEPEADYQAALDALAKYDLTCIYMHPHMAVKLHHWDGPNYSKANKVKWREWKQVEDRDPAATAIYYERFKRFIQMMKRDGRFEITDFEALKASLKPRRTITPADLPAIRASLLKDFGPIAEPASWSVADAFQAAVRLLRGEIEYRPAKVYGFLARPCGVTVPVKVSAEALRATAKTIDLTKFLPASLKVGQATIGPADFLFAALEVLTTGASEVTVTPREQLGSFKLCPGIEQMNISGKWAHTPAFKDQYLSERLRLQLWTMRIE